MPKHDTRANLTDHHTSADTHTIDDAHSHRRARTVIQDASANDRLASLIRSLQDPSPQIREAAAYALGWFRSEEAIPHLLTLLGDDNQNVLPTAIWSLANIASDKHNVLVQLVEAHSYLNASRGEALTAAIDLAVTLCNSCADLVQPLMHCLKSNDALAVRLEVIRLLGALRSPATEAVDALRMLATDSNERIRIAAARSLQNIGTPLSEQIPDLMRLVADSSATVRASAASSLGKLGSGAAAALPHLIQALQDDDPRVRAEAARAINKVGPDAAKALPFLIPMLGDKDCRVREAASSAIPGISADAQVEVHTTEDLHVASWFAGLNLGEWLERMQVFWCIGYIEKDAIMNAGDAMGFDRLSKKLEGMKKTGQLANLPTSQGFIRNTLEELGSLFNCGRFPAEAWADDERFPDFREDRFRGKRRESRWTRRARKAWLYVDRFLKIKGMDVSIDAGEADRRAEAS